jgi:hypothetical protein
MAKSRPAGFGALRGAVAALGAFGLTRCLIGRHVQCTRRLGIAGSGGSLSFGSGQGSLVGKSGTREQHGKQDTKHKAHDVTPFVAIPVYPRGRARNGPMVAAIVSAQVATLGKLLHRIKHHERTNCCAAAMIR